MAHNPSLWSMGESHATPQSNVNSRHRRYFEVRMESVQVFGQQIFDAAVPMSNSRVEDSEERSPGIFALSVAGAYDVSSLLAHGPSSTFLPDVPNLTTVEHWHRMGGSSLHTMHRNRSESVAYPVALVTTPQHLWFRRFYQAHCLTTTAIRFPIASVALFSSQETFTTADRWTLCPTSRPLLLLAKTCAYATSNGRCI